LEVDAMRGKSESQATVAQYFEQHYRTEVMVDCRVGSVADARRAVQALKEAGNATILRMVRSARAPSGQSNCPFEETQRG
jgi:hypothetical protein